MKNDLTEQEAQWAVAVGLVLRRTRKQAKLVQEEVAYKAGMGRLTMQRIEHGATSPNLVTLLRLCRALDIQPSTLLIETERLIQHPQAFEAALEAKDAELSALRARAGNAAKGPSAKI
ncbi:MAG: helix-turn-helix domain-containing protein [Acidobacteriota bacterium]